MPTIKIQSVVEASSECDDHPAANLLRTNQFKPWKCREWQQSAFVILQLPEPARIDSLEIGNESSAFIEVLVCRSSEETRRFQVLLSTSSFMTPSESKSMSNTNRVRLFPAEKLSPMALKSKWDLIKVVCNQPFNKTAPFGVAFIKLNAPAEEEDDIEPEQMPNFGLNLGPFKMMTRQDDVGIEQGSLFSKRTRNGGAEASVKPEDKKAEGSLSLSKAVKTPEKPKTPKQTKKAEEEANKYTPKDVKKTANTPKNEERSNKSENNKPRPSTSKQSDESPRSNGPSSAKKAKKPDKQVPYNKILDGVVFVLSGYENPNRGRIRDLAIEMGGEFRQNWDRRCTHLICAFVKTPKYQEVVKKQGRIVTEEWIHECHVRKKRLPWRDYKLGKYKSPPPTPPGSDEEEVEEEQPVVQYYEEETDEEQFEEEKQKDQNQTDDEVYDQETDKESETEEANSQQATLLDLFTSKVFYFHGKFDATERKSLKRLIIFYDGQVEDSLTQEVNVIVTKSWSRELDEARERSDSLLIVDPKWVFDCNSKAKLISPDAYRVQPPGD